MPRTEETAAERQARLGEIRRQIEAGTYDTRERLSAAIDAMLADFSDGSGDAGAPLDRESGGWNDSDNGCRRPK